MKPTTTDTSEGITISCDHYRSHVTFCLCGPGFHINTSKGLRTSKLGPKSSGRRWTAAALPTSSTRGRIIISYWLGDSLHARLLPNPVCYMSGQKGNLDCMFQPFPRIKRPYLNTDKTPNCLMRYLLLNVSPQREQRAGVIQLWALPRRSYWVFCLRN